MSKVLVVWVVIASTGPAAAQAWEDASALCPGVTGGWSDAVALADLDADGQLDLVVANSGGDAVLGSDERVRVWRNTGPWTGPGPACTEVSTQVVGDFVGRSRAIAVGDLDGDGALDLVVGGAWQSQLRLFVHATPAWTDATARLPQQLTSVGDLALGDVDADGDLDLVLLEWGAGEPATGGGGRTRLYLNDGSATFTEATPAQMPDVLVRQGWDVQLVDVDQDADLDALIACRACATSLLFRNDGLGMFTEDPAAFLALPNNHGFVPMDLDGDGDLDLVALNTGPDLREQLLINDGTGAFVDDTAARLPPAANPAGTDDAAAVWLDLEGDGDPDLLIVGRGPDRVLLNTGAVFALAVSSTPDDTPGSRAIAVGDLDGDGRPDLWHGQGGTGASPEASTEASTDKVQRATAGVAVDATPPRIWLYPSATTGPGAIRARVHDGRSGSGSHDFDAVWIEHDGFRAHVLESSVPTDLVTAMTWAGGYLWSSPELTYVSYYRVCARDRRGNAACSDWAYPDGARDESPRGDDTYPHDGGPFGAGDSNGAGCCDAGASPRATLVPLLLIALGWRRRRRPR